MNDNEKKWLDSAIERATRAAATGVTLLLLRNQDSNDEGDYVVTNATTPEMVRALSPKDESE